MFFTRSDFAAVRPLTETSQNQPGESSRRNNPIPEFIRRARDCSMVVAELHTDFERTGECGKSFDYSQLPRTTDASEARQQMNACMTAIQRGGHIQPFGCLILVEEASSKVIGYIENAHEMLGLNRDALGIGSDVFTLFSLASVAQLELALGDREMILNSVWIHSHSGRAFYAILHKIDVGIVMDLEPARIEDPDLSITRNLQTQRTTASEISKLESLPTANINLLYNTLVQSIRQLTGYDRVMVYKFHEDYHGEIVAESKKNELNPHIGLHYPATDIPQVSKCLSKVNRVRMIVDSQAPPVRIIQDESLTQPLSLVGSTLRAPHSCHNQYMANMGAIASLVLSIIINDDNVIGYGRFMRLWGLVLCHHSSPRSISYPDRNALEFLMRAFALQLNLELQLASQSLERHVLRTQNLLHSLFMREFPTGIITQSPNLKDLVKCDGAALYFKGRYYPLGVAPSETQIHDLLDWFINVRRDAIFFRTTRLADSGCPRASSLGDAICGVAAARLTVRDFLFWFRSPIPRSSFRTVSEMIEHRSLPWEGIEFDAIHSLRLVLRGELQSLEASSLNN